MRVFIRQVVGLIGIMLVALNAQAADEAGTAAETPELPAVHGLFRNTNYYLVNEAKYSELKADTEIRDMDGTVIVTVSQAFRAAMDIEGSGKLIDGRVINYAGRIDGEIRYEETIHPWGRGVGNCALVPFHTIAVDKNTIPLGSVVRIDETVGIELPDGTKHDGLWRAEDVGGAIKKQRIDLFIGSGENDSFLRKAKIKNLQALTVRIIVPAPEKSCLQESPR